MVPKKESSLQHENIKMNKYAEKERHKKNIKENLTD